MTTAIRSLLAASAAALLAAPTARAHACDDDLRAPPAPAWAPPPAALPAPPQAWAPPAAVPAPPPELVVRPIEWGPRWAGPLAGLRAEYIRLELARERFYAGWRGNPWSQRRFETWYAVRRAELDRRAEWLTERAGWRPDHHPHGNAWGWREHDRDDDD